MEAITGALDPLGPHPGRHRLHLPRQLRLHHRPGLLLRVQPRRHRRVAAQTGLARRDGRGLGPLRGVAPAAGGRHRDRRGHRVGPLVDRRSRPHLPDGDGPVLPGPPRCRPADLRRPPGPRRHRRRHRRRALHGRGGRAAHGARATSRRCWPRSTSASRCAATMCPRSPTVPPPWCWPPEIGPVSWSSDRPTSPDSTTGPSATTLVPGPRTTRPPPASPPQPPAWATRPVEVAELQAAFTHEELLLRRVLELGDEVAVNPSGGALRSNPIMATGLCRIGYAADHIFGGGQPGPGPLDLGPVPATEPHLHPGGIDHERDSVRRRRRGPDPPQVPPTRRVLRRPGARGRLPCPRRRPDDPGRHRRRGPRARRPTSSRA